MPCCLVALLSLFIPRIVLFFIWLFSDAFSRAYETIVWPVLGFIFVPYTTLAYMGAMLYNNHEVNVFWGIVIVVAVLADLGSLSSGPVSRRK
jgi:hypothetical protein